MSVPKKYETIDFKPPEAAAGRAARGLELRSEHGRGGTGVGIARGRDLKNRASLSPDTIRRMTSYFARHAVDRSADGFGDEDDPSNGFIAWLLWGGDEGREWAEGIEKQMDEAEPG